MGKYIADAARKIAGVIAARAIRIVVLLSQRRADQELKQFMRIILDGLRKLLKTIVILRKDKKRLKNMKNG